jgi:hypothetical protein
MTDPYITAIVKEIRETLHIPADDLEFNRSVGTEILRHVLQMKTMNDMINIGLDKLTPMIEIFYTDKLKEKIKDQLAVPDSSVSQPAPLIFPTPVEEDIDFIWKELASA